MKRIIFYFLTTLCLLVLSLVFPQSAFAAKFNLDPLTKNIKVGEQFSISIGLDTQGKDVSGVEVKLSFNKDLIEVSGVDFSGIFPANDKNINNGDGYVQISSNMEGGVTSFHGNSHCDTVT